MRVILLDKRLAGSRSLVLPAGVLWGVPVLVLLCVMGAFSVGYRHAQAQAGAVPQDLIAVWKQELAGLGKQTNALSQRAERDNRAYFTRVAALQARLLRMEAVGERLASAADLNDGEFNFREEPAVGGPFSAESLPAKASAAELGLTLDRLSALIADRERQFEVMEELLSDRKIAIEVTVAGKPVANGYLSSLFGRRTDPFDGRPAWHKGIDFTAPVGTPVIAVASGVVTSAAYDKDYGYLVEVRHSDGYRSRYAHNREYNVKTGDVVKKGQVIARVGRSGRASGTHLHFEVLKDGALVNPMPYITAARD